MACDNLMHHRAETDQSTAGGTVLNLERLHKIISTLGRDRRQRITIHYKSDLHALGQTPGKYTLLCMKPVFRLIPNHRLRPVQHIGRHLFIPVGNTFGSNTSSQTFDVVAAARSRLACFLAGAARRGLHRPTAFAIEDRIVFPPPPPPTPSGFTRALADTRNPGVPIFLGTAPPAPHNMFVDDNLMANLRGCIRADINASIESLFKNVRDVFVICF